METAEASGVMSAFAPLPLLHFCRQSKYTMHHAELGTDCMGLGGSGSFKDKSGPLQYIIDTVRCHYRSYIVSTLIWCYVILTRSKNECGSPITVIG